MEKEKKKQTKRITKYIIKKFYLFSYIQMSFSIFLDQSMKKLSKHLSNLSTSQDTNLLIKKNIV